MSDPEIVAMSRVSEVLGELDEGARNRVLLWAADKYQVRLHTKSPLPDNPQAEEQGGSLQDTFGDFADLFDAVNPNTEADKALVAAYWLQALQGAQSFQSAELNNLLKDLGQRIANITDALSSSIEQKPALILQLKKSGSSRQSRKTYKLTKAGSDRVKEMMG